MPLSRSHAAGIPFEDKPGIAADVTDSPYAGNVYVGWTEFRLDGA